MRLTLEGSLGSIIQETTRDWRAARSSQPAASVTALGAAFLLTAMLACATGTGLTREQVLEQVDAIGTLDARLDRAGDEGLDALAPRGVAAASQLLEEAITEAQDGQAVEAQRLAGEGLERLDRAEKDARETSNTLRVVLERRQRAINANAPTLLPGRFEALEQGLRDAARRVENGDVEAAKDARPDLLRGYSALELDALETDATEVARIAIDRARDADAHRHAPDTFGRAEKELSIAIGILETDRNRVEQANVHSRRAAEFAAQSQYIAELAKEFDRRDYDREQVLLWYQRQVEDLTSPLERDIAFTKPNHEVIGDARDEIASALSGRRDAEAKLAAAQERLAALEVASTATAGDLEARLNAVQLAQRESEARYDRVRSLFTADEAVVYQRGGDVLLRTYGFQFPVGQSEIRSENFPLLSKISQAIAVFDDPAVSVTGHTDATGSTEVNQRLSEERAQKVGDFLVQVGRLDPNRVSTSGSGEAEPLASNETPDGRARNRRIEILIVNSAAGGQSLPAVSAAPDER